MANEKRLIDANALLEAVEKSDQENFHKGVANRSIHHYEHRHFLSMVLNAPSRTAERRMTMREILFRGKMIHNDEWKEGYLVGPKHIGDWVTCEPIHPETAGQFTGKKDVNGTKVFEHDILQIFTVWADGTREKAGIAIVQWRENDQCYVLTTKEGYHIDDFGNLGRPEYYEVIGNIHDNPELLEV